VAPGSSINGSDYIEWSDGVHPQLAAAGHTTAVPLPHTTISPLLQRSLQFTAGTQQGQDTQTRVLQQLQWQDGGIRQYY
jgi:hypothetical protein